ncbi:hypothetical protein M2140_001752 [Clostridiales Family XIII bacterium PM5-7]
MNQMNAEDRRREIQEAISAGELTLQYLQQARQELDSAAGFGIADLLGFDLIGGIGKHMKLGNAKNHMENAKKQVMLFQQELRDVSAIVDFDVNIGDFLTFADFFFDGLIADVIVQSRIGDAKNQIETATRQIQAILQDLYHLLSRA